MSPESPSQELRISNVFVVPGHIFVAVSSKNGVLPRGEMYNKMPQHKYDSFKFTTTLQHYVTCYSIMSWPVSF